MTPRVFTQASSNPFAARAIKAYCKSAAGAGQVMQPASQPKLWTRDDGKQYIVLDNCRGVLAVYRVRNDGKLKGLKRWPAVFNTMH